ncbi:helix-turn-helix domain-containing protein [uncultured Clostridium sp.]|uniref:helix-turn-helix domain-containing protein n=1 Tax=uncultured Clostridium sp. TaxID=59620 RepID=UPI0027311E5F|nr:helix-turn-helix transcriptional regulator [uncultured Clostridium sp.]
MKITPIKIRRINLGLEVDETIEKLKISKSTLYKLEQGHTGASAQLIARMARLYKCTTDEIFKELNIKG